MNVRENFFIIGNKSKTKSEWEMLTSINLAIGTRLRAPQSAFH